MTTQSDAIIAFILKHEGGYVNDPHDAGVKPILVYPSGNIPIWTSKT
jgi:hypothetical protein